MRITILAVPHAMVNGQLTEEYVVLVGLLPAAYARPASARLRAPCQIY